MHSDQSSFNIFHVIKLLLMLFNTLKFEDVSLHTNP